jgi:hypothetical protein
MPIQKRRKKGKNEGHPFKFNFSLCLVATTFFLSSLLKYLPLPLFSFLFVKTLEALGLADKRPVHGVQIDAPTIDAFRLIKEHDCSAVAVLGKAGDLIGTVSSRDVRLLLQANAGPL